MGLTSWKNAPDGKIVKADVSVAKNYLSMDEMQELNEIVTMYLDYATRQPDGIFHDHGRLGLQAGRFSAIQ
mgnify:CR=1 FL=1